MFPKQLFTLVSQSSAVFWANGCCFRKVANYSLHLSPKWVLLHKSSLEGSAKGALHLFPSFLLGSKLCELLTCLTHTNPVRKKRPIMLLLLGYSLGLFFKHWFPRFGSGSKPSLERCSLWYPLVSELRYDTDINEIMLMLIYSLPQISHLLAGMASLIGALVFFVATRLSRAMPC